MPTFTLSRRHALLAVVCASSVVFAASRLVAAPSPPSSKATASALLTPPAAHAPAPRGVVVDVEGAVRRPGLYRLRTGARIADAIARAGGVTRHADKAHVNLAAPLADGEQVLVPRVGSSGVSATGVAGSSPATPVNLNSATAAELDALPGVGPVTAQKIVDYRREHGPFTSVDQLDAISGIGPTRIDNLRGHVLP